MFWASGSTRGFSLLEAAVAVMIMSMVILISLEITMVASTSFTDKVTKSTLEVKGERTLKLVVEAVTESAQLGVGPEFTSITFFVPFDNDGDGTVLTGNSINPDDLGNLEFGAVTQAGAGNGTITFQFIPQDVFTEAAENLDLNGDGDLNDVFDVGYIEQSSTLPGDMPFQIGVNNIVQRQGAWGTSILFDNNPGDTTGQIFELPAGTRVLNVNLWLMASSRDRRAYLVRCNEQVFLRNQ